MDERVMAEIVEDRFTTAMKAELWDLVNQGLLEMGVTEEGEAIFWPTPRGCIELGMEVDETPDSYVLLDENR
jgi:hypothetical protein